MMSLYISAVGRGIARGVNHQYIYLCGCNIQNMQLKTAKRSLEYEEGRPAEAAQKNYEDAHGPAAATVAGAVRHGMDGRVLRPWENNFP